MTSPISALATIAQVTLRRARRSRSLWIALGIAALPILMAVVVAAVSRSHDVDIDAIYAINVLVLMIVPPMLVAASIGDDIEDRTNTYLWSRPIPRWTVLIGKVVALAPVVVVMLAATWAFAVQAGTHRAPTAGEIAGVAAGAFGASALSAGLATLVPKHGMAVSIVYMLLVDVPIGAIPASLQNISITHQTRLIAGIERSSHDPSPAVSAISLAVISLIWLAIGVWRMRRLEA